MTWDDWNFYCGLGLLIISVLTLAGLGVWVYFGGDDNDRPDKK